MDVIVGLNEVVHTSLNERTLAGFGNPGIHRLTSYGVEYKTPSNFWLRSEANRKWVFDTSIFIINEVRKDATYYDKYLSRYSTTIQRVRGRWRQNEATALLNDFNGFRPFPS